MQRFARLALIVSSVVVACLTLPAIAGAQGLTTGGISGTVRAAGGTPIEGANVRIADPSTGFVRVTSTRTGGRFVVTGLETGTYRVTFTAIGYAPKTVENVKVALTQSARVEIELSPQAVQVQELVVQAPASASDFASTRTGAVTSVSDTMVSRLPTLNRQLQDFVKLTPQVTFNPGARGELSAAGQNNRFNAIQVDGTTQNDRFGLGDTGELGGQANGRGISLEAVKEYQVVLSPYNVTQGGFTGALVNAVTKNGTNDFKISGFYTFRNQDLATNEPFIANTKFNIKQFGASVGGPIIKDKMHFFVAGELQRSLKPANGPYVGQTGVTGSNAVRVDAAMVNRFNAALGQYGIAGGNGDQADNENPIANVVGRIDWQLSPSSRLVLRNIYNDSKGDDFSRSATVFALTSNRFKRSEHSNSITAQLFKNLGNGATNETQIGWIRQRFARAFDNLGPQITINTEPSATVPGQTVKLVAGPDSSSHVNQLDQDFIEFRNDLTFSLASMPNHLFTVGTRDDYYKIRNAFWQNKFGSWGFTTLADLEAGTPSSYAVGVAVGDPVAHFSAMNLAFYAQDQWSIKPHFTLTLGLRAEGPIFNDKPGFRQEVFTDLNRRTDEVPSNITWNPRLGFNWDVAGRGNTQVRGGVGLFAGIAPYVWLSNVYTNNGLNGVAQLTCNGGSNPAPPAFTTGNAANAPQSCNGVGPTTGTNIGAVNTVDPNFKMPQVLRATLGMDRRLPLGLTWTVDGMYTKSFNSPYMVNLELPDPVGQDYGGRTMYGTIGTNGRATTTFKHGTRYSGGAFDMRNTSKDYSYSITTGVTKRFNGSIEGSAFYTYGRSYSVADFTSSTARSNFQNGRQTSTDQFDTRLDPSAFDRPHRVAAALTWTAPWKNYQTAVSFIYNGQSGTNFAYVYQTGVTGSGDLNADGITGNDLIYIPNSGSELNFEAYTGTTQANTTSHSITAAEQAAAFDEFLKSMPCMEKQKGHIMTRGSCKNPWFNTLDLSIKQSLPSISGHGLTLQADIYNFLNFLNGDWGQYRQNNRFPNVNLLQHRGNTADGKPIVRFDPNLALKDFRFPKVQTANNFWQAQVTVRYAY